MTIATPRKGFLATGFIGAAAFGAGFAVAEAAEDPVSNWPDFSAGVAAWDGIGQGDFKAVPGSPEPIGQDPNYERVPNNVGGQPNYRISDVSNPNLKDWARDIMRTDNEEVLAGKIAYTARSHCQPGGVPNFDLMGGGVMHFLQTPDMVVMIHDGDEQMRRVHLNVPHSDNPNLSWYGESVGHYEGNTLVVDTIALDERSFIDAYRTPHTGALHVVERFTLLEGGDQIDLLVTIDDPGTFNEPWQGTHSFERVPATLEEIICAENNEHLFGSEIPRDDTPDF
jgi:hypothetical protein